LDGAGDHLVSEALYLSDPEGNGIEMYRDRPRNTWEYKDGQIQMDTLSVDLQSLVDEANGNTFGGLPNESEMGHIHLQVNHVPTSAAFFQDVLGFDLIAQMPGAGFLSAGGYHHHIGMNTWRSSGGGLAPANALGLMDYEVVLPHENARDDLLGRLSENQIAFDQQDGMLRVQDPAGIWIEFVLRK
jgi:catechol 2,3-dioxygenase